jgi:hypothetical protein
LAVAFLVFPLMLLLLIPVIFIEAIVIRRRLGCVELWPLLRVTAVANVVSTILGIPLTGAGYLLVAILSGSRNHLVRAALEGFIWPWDASSAVTRTWAVPLADFAFLVILVPYFLVSVWSERKVFERMLPVAEEASIFQIPSILVSRPTSMAEALPLRKAGWVANVVSYVVMFGVFCLSAQGFRA